MFGGRQMEPQLMKTERTAAEEKMSGPTQPSASLKQTHAAIAPGP